MVLAVTAVAVVVVVAPPVVAVAQQPLPHGDLAAGRRVFVANCAMCHGADASGMMGMHPSLRGAVDRLSREGVELTIRRGRRTQPPMPAWEGRLTDGQIDDVIAYIASLPAGPRNFGPEAGGGMMGGGSGGMGGWWVAALIAAGLLVALIAIEVVRRASVSPRRLLDRRYASGELTREEYLQRRDDLRRPPS